MQPITLTAPEGIDLAFGTSSVLSEHERRHQLARDLISNRYGLSPVDIRLRREAPGAFGHHTHLSAGSASESFPLVIKAGSSGAGTVVAVSDFAVPLGVSLLSTDPDAAEVAMIHRHTHLFPDADESSFFRHWVRVQAIREADGRGARVSPDRVRLDPVSSKGWIPDRRVHYDVTDMTVDGWLVALAFVAGPR